MLAWGGNTIQYNQIKKGKENKKNNQFEAEHKMREDGRQLKISNPASISAVS